MIVATRVWRSFLMLILLIFGISSSSMVAMVWDNRYFPWFDQLYKASDNTHGYLDVNAFFIVDRDAFRFEHRADKKDQVVSLPGLWGKLDLTNVGKSLVAVGKPNPIPQDWQWLSDFDAATPSSMDGQGVAFACYAPIGKHFGIGANNFVMKLSSFVTVVPGDNAVSKLNLETSGNQVLFTQMMHDMYQELGIVSTSYQEVGVGDTIVFACIHDTQEYKYKFRKIDWGSYFGIIIPTATKQNPYNLASIPFGGGDGMWGWFVAPFAEIELKDDWIIGCQLRLTQRLDRCINMRIPVGDEQTLFAPIVGSVNINSGITVSFAPYLVFQDLRAGFGMQAKYLITVHEHDYFTARLNNGLAAHFSDTNYYSGWTQEYLSIRLFYDVAHDKNWQKRPLCYLTWDIPMNHIAGRGFAKTNRVSIGCNVNF